MKYHNRHAAVLALFAAAIAFAPTGRASTIIPPFTASGSGTSTATVNTVAPGNDNVLGQSPNTFNIFENLTGNFFVQQFDISSSARSTEYFVTKAVTNNTNQPWTSFQIGVGCNGFTPGFSPCPFVIPAVMDYDLNPTSSAGGTLSSVTGVSFGWTGLNVAPGQTVTFTFSMDVCPGCSGTWGIAQQAGTATPEPGTVLMGSTGLALIALGTLRRGAQRWIAGTNFFVHSSEVNLNAVKPDSFTAIFAIYAGTLHPVEAIVFQKGVASRRILSRMNQWSDVSVPAWTLTPSKSVRS